MFQNYTYNSIIGDSHFYSLPFAPGVLHGSDSHLIHYGVAVLIVISGVAVGVVSPVPGVLVAPAAGVLLVLVAATVGCATSGQASRSTGKSAQVLASVQILIVRGVISGPLQSTTCRPLFTSTVVQIGVVDATEVVDVVVVGGGETISKVAVSGSTKRACAVVSTQNWHSTSTISPVTGMPGVPVPAVCVPAVFVVDVETALVSVPLTVGVSTAVSAVLVVAVSVSAVPVASVDAPKGVLVASSGSDVPTRVGVVSSAAQAAVISTRIIAPNKSRRENFLIFLSPSIACIHSFLCMQIV